MSVVGTPRLAAGTRAAPSSGSQGAARTTSLDYRFLSSMQGGLGIGANLTKWRDEDFTTAAKWVAAYKTIRIREDRARERTDARLQALAKSLGAAQ